jgi:hypothetical protein
VVTGTAAMSVHLARSVPCVFVPAEHSKVFISLIRIHLQPIQKALRLDYTSRDS